MLDRNQLFLLHILVQFLELQERLFLPIHSVDEALSRDFKIHGLPLRPEQPHHGGVMAAANVTGRVSLPTNSYTDMLHAVATVGPLTVTVDAGAWHDYESGVFTGGNHTNPDLDHLDQLIGYGTDANGGDYWTIRNSWTPH